MFPTENFNLFYFLIIFNKYLKQSTNITNKVIRIEQKPILTLNSTEKIVNST